MLGSVWPFLKDPANVAVLGSIGAGIAVIAAGAWAVFTYFDKKKEKGPSAPSVIINLDAAAVVAPINERLEQLAAQVARDKGVAIAPLRAILVKLGEADVKDEDILRRPDEKAAAMSSSAPISMRFALRSERSLEGRAGWRG